MRLAGNPRVQLFFFDVNRTEINDVRHRDSLMYLKIKHRIWEHPNWRTLTLSGNIHNMRVQFRAQPTAAYYLCHDDDLELSGRICTLNHTYLSGTARNSVGRGLELRQVKQAASVYSETLGYDKYLFLFPHPNSYDGMLFTKTVTASELTAGR
jgi:hypothetical protein